MTVSARGRIALVIVGLALASAVGVVVVTSKVNVSVEYQGSVDGVLTVVAGEDVPVRVMVDPSRRVDGLRVTLDGRPVLHPEGDGVGEVVWDPSALAPGSYQLRIEVPRPAWFPAVTTIEVIVVEDVAAN